MSDLYLTLRHRLADVAHDWVEIDGELLVAARGRKGLSREALGAQVGVVAKTVERYEHDNRIPRSVLPRFAEALDLDIQEAGPTPVVIPAESQSLDELTKRVAGVEGELRQLRETLREAIDEQRKAILAAMGRLPEQIANHPARNSSSRGR